MRVKLSLEITCKTVNNNSQENLIAITRLVFIVTSKVLDECSIFVDTNAAESVDLTNSNEGKLRQFDVGKGQLTLTL